MAVGRATANARHLSRDLLIVVVCSLRCQEGDRISPPYLNINRPYLRIQGNVPTICDRKVLLVRIRFIQFSYNWFFTLISL